MDMDKILQYIPQVLLYIVPGFISVRIKEICSNQKKHDQFGYIALCVLYSFISIIMYKAIKYVITFFAPTTSDFLNKNTIETCICLAVSVLLGIVIAKLPKTGIGRWFTSFMDANNTPESSVWESAMCNENGAWAYVFLRNGMVYYGELLDYTSDPEESYQELTLYNFWTYIRKEGDDVSPSSFLVPVNKIPDNQNKVLLKRDDIISIEIYPGLEPTIEERAIKILEKRLEKKEGKEFIKKADNWQEKTAVLHYQPINNNKKWIEGKLQHRKCTEQKDEEKQTHTLHIKKGFIFPSKVLAIVAVRDDDLLIAAYAEEKLWRRHSAEKIVKRISKKIPRKEAA